MFVLQTTKWLIMEFSERLAAQRKERGMTQKALSKQVGVHITQIQRYENGSIQPTLDVLRRLAVALSVSADLLVFGKDERGPDEDLKLEFEALSQFDPEVMLERWKEIDTLAPPERERIVSVLDSLIRDAKTRQAYRATG